MKLLIVFVALFAVALARPAEIEIVSLDVDVQPGSYKFAFETTDGTKQNAEGHLNDAGSDHEENVVNGSYTFVDPEGKGHTVKYVADKNGYQPSGDDIPTA